MLICFYAYTEGAYATGRKGENHKASTFTKDFEKVTCVLCKKKRLKAVQEKIGELIFAINASNGTLERYRQELSVLEKDCA